MKYLKPSASAAALCLLAPLSAQAISTLPADIAGAPESGLVLWLRAGADVVADGSNKVSSWGDVSGGARHATQATSSFQPQLVSSAIGGKPALRFDGVDDVLALPDGTVPSGNSAYTVFAVVQSTTLANRGFLGSGNSATGEKNSFRFSGGGEVINYWWANDIVSPSASVAANTPYILDFTYNSTSGRTARRHGKNIATNTSISRNGGVANNVIGWTAHSAEYWSGDIAEIIIYSRALTESERTGIENYLALKYQLGASTALFPQVGAGETGIFQLGDTGASVTFTVASSVSGSLSSARFAANPGGSFTGGNATSNDGSSIIPTIYSPYRYWQINATDLSGFTYSVAVDITSLPGVSDADKLVILKRPDGSTNPWTPVNTTRVGNYLLSSGLTSFSEFGVGSDGSGGTLPVTLTGFAAE